MEKSIQKDKAREALLKNKPGELIIFPLDVIIFN